MQSSTAKTPPGAAVYNMFPCWCGLQSRCEKLPGRYCYVYFKLSAVVVLGRYARSTAGSQQRWCRSTSAGQLCSSLVWLSPSSYVRQESMISTLLRCYGSVHGMPWRAHRPYFFFCRAHAWLMSILLLKYYTAYQVFLNFFYPI